MLLFEFFPAVVAIVGVLVAIALYVADRRAQKQGLDDHRPVGSRPDVPADKTDERPGRGRPSMRG